MFDLETYHFLFIHYSNFLMIFCIFILFYIAINTLKKNFQNCDLLWHIIKVVAKTLFVYFTVIYIVSLVTTYKYIKLKSEYSISNSIDSASKWNELKHALSKISDVSGNIQIPLEFKDNKKTDEKNNKKTDEKTDKKTDEKTDGKNNDVIIYNVYLKETYLRLEKNYKKLYSKEEIQEAYKRFLEKNEELLKY